MAKENAGISYCGEVTTVDFMAGQHYNAGFITVGNDEDNLYVTFSTINGWKMTKTHLYVGSEAGLPKNAAPGQFTYKADHKGGVTTYTYTIPLAGLDPCMVVAAHAEVNGGVDANGKSLGGQTAWGKGDRDYPNANNWSWIIDFCKQSCTPPEDDEETPVLGPSYGSVTATNAGMGGTYIVPKSNHFVYAVLNKTDLLNGPIALDFVVGNKIDLVGTGSVALVDGNLVVTIDNFGAGKFGITAFNQVPTFGNGNIHAQKEKDLAKFGATTGFSHNNVSVVPCPTGNTIYLYIHCDPIQFYL